MFHFKTASNEIVYIVLDDECANETKDAGEGQFGRFVVALNARPASTNTREP